MRTNVYDTKLIRNWVMLMSALRTLVKNPVKESFDITFMGNEKAVKILIVFFFP